MSEQQTRTAEPAREVVFVLRLRAGSDGWWGQLRNVDEPNAEYVRSTAHLLALLESYWQLARTASGATTQT